jgi:hypothetical protein
MIACAFAQGTPGRTDATDVSRNLSSSFFEGGGLKRVASTRSMATGSSAGGCCGRRSQSYCRLAVAFAYFVLAIVLTSVTMVFVHDRVPDQDKFPPLPGTAAIPCLFFSPLHFIPALVVA